MPAAKLRAVGGACALLCAMLVTCTSCHPSGARFPWSALAPPGAVEHADVHTLNTDYHRRGSHVLVRQVTRPTRAALDYAAYAANFMIADPVPETAVPGGPLVTERPFAGLIERASLTPDVARTPLTAAERSHPLAFAPLVEYLLAHKIAGADKLEDLASAIRSEGWGAPPIPGVAAQTISAAFIHTPAKGPAELWVRVEFAPWFDRLGRLPDQDRDGVPELYGRARDGITRDVVAALASDYAGHELSASEVKAWANQLSSYWYPSFNTDLLAPGTVWPDAGTEPAIAGELHGQTFAAPTIVLRGKPEGRPTYEIFLVRGLAQAPAATAAGQTPAALELAHTQVTPDPEPLAQVLRAELAAHGGSAAAWDAQLDTFHNAVRKRLASSPKSIKALAGEHGFLFYRNSLEYALGGDLERQAAGKNPLPVIFEFKRRLAELGVDFLFVPVPAKAEVFPDEVAAKLGVLAGQVVVPWSRQFLLSLATQGIESVDLLTPFLRARSASENANQADQQEPLYQHQDTHWSQRGIELAAQLLAERVKRYPWYRDLTAHAQTFATSDTTFTRFGDLQSRLPEAQKKRYQPETLRARQVLRADGGPYEDDPDSPIVVLGDSFTGVYELTDAEHAGLSAHLARDLSYPVDLVMSYGGGPNVRNKLMRRGTAALAKKKLVIWVMAARDLYNYWEDWEPLAPP